MVYNLPDLVGILAYHPKLIWPYTSVVHPILELGAQSDNVYSVIWVAYYHVVDVLLREMALKVVRDADELGPP
jgi:hypothetical protein